MPTVVIVVGEVIAIIEFITIKFDVIIDDLEDSICGLYLNYPLFHLLFLRIMVEGFFNRSDSFVVTRIRIDKIFALASILCVEGAKANEIMCSLNVVFEAQFPISHN
jgi:hypothetical protein